jgi:hypothetical protein
MTPFALQAAVRQPEMRSRANQANSSGDYMKNWKAFLAVAVSVCMCATVIPVAPLQAAASGASAATAVAVAPLPWPRVIDRDGNHVVVYQPQLRSWQNYRTLVADSAISITLAGQQKPILGVVSWKADTIANVSTRTVFVRNIEVLSSRFPSLPPDQEAMMEQRMHAVYPTVTLTISLDRMIASLQKINTPPVQSIAVSPEVPKILVSTTPAIVLLVNGKPVLAPVQGTELQYVVNTNWDLFYDKADYYLLNGSNWLKAKELAGPWTATMKLPVEMSKLPASNWSEVLKAVPPPAGARPAPKVFFTDRPAELIVFRGQPVYAPVPGTTLAVATNTDSTVFQHKPDNQVYALLSGRWFRAGNVEAPWVYAGNNLPADFARIPQGHSYSEAIVSVPGTQEASDAVLLSQVPTTAIVNRAEAEAAVKVSYAGDPQFVAIESTTMFYAVNTPAKVIRVGDVYYLCYQGIWFVGKNPMGPWKTADLVPQVIYTIPPSSPMYNVTYVIVSNPTPTTVETSYSSGYLGVFVLGMAVGATVVYGTGWYYPPYIYYGPHYPIYYPYPYTYGVAAIYNPYTGFYAVGHAAYGPYASVGTAAWYNPATGMYGHAVTTQNAYGGHTYASAYNPWTGTYAATSQGHNEYAQWGSSVVTNGNNWAEAQHYTNANGTSGSFQTSKGSEGAGVTGKNGNSAFVAKDANNNNVYAGADGNVYKKDSSGDWSKWDNGGWTPVDPSTGAAQTKKQSSQNLSGATQNQKGQNQSGNLSGATQNQKGQSQNGNLSGATQNQNGQKGQDRSGNLSGATQNQTPSTNSGGEAGNGSRAQGRENQTPSTAPGSAGSSDTMNQLNKDSGSRSRGDQLEQQGRSSGGGRGASRGSSGGGRSPRR